MILHGNPNNWSCLPAAFAMVLGMDPEEFIKQIGHDGSDEPYRRESLKAGFHEQECIEVLQRWGYACTPIEIMPRISPHSDGWDARSIFFGGGGTQDNWDRLLYHLEYYCGVLTGLYTPPARAEVGHAVAWDFDTRMIYDPIAGGLIYSLEDAHKYGFTPGCFWKVQNVIHG